MKIFIEEEEKMNRKKRTIYTYNLLKSKLLDCPNVEFNQYVLDLAKHFSKDGTLEIIEYYSRGYMGVDFDIITTMDDVNETVRFYLKNENNTVKAIIERDYKTRIFDEYKKHYLLREIAFDEENNVIKVTDSNCDHTEKATWIFENNVLIYRSIQKGADTEFLRIDKYYDAVNEKYSRIKIDDFYKANCVYFTFSNLIKGENLNMTEKRISQREMYDFTNNWAEWLKTKNALNVEKDIIYNLK